MKKRLILLLLAASVAATPVMTSAEEACSWSNEWLGEWQYETPSDLRTTAKASDESGSPEESGIDGTLTEEDPEGTAWMDPEREEGWDVQSGEENESEDGGTAEADAGEASDSAEESTGEGFVESESESTADNADESGAESADESGAESVDESGAESAAESGAESAAESSVKSMPEEPDPEPVPADRCGDDLFWRIDETDSGSVLRISGTGKMYNYYPHDYETEAPWTDCGVTYDSVVIEEGVTGIGNYAFYNGTMDSVSLPSTLISIGKNAFGGSRKLTAVTLPPSLKQMGPRVFRNCSKLESITIPASVTEIPADAFYRCTSLTSVTLPDSIGRIGTDAFGECTSLTAIRIPPRVSELEDGVFEECSSLTSVQIPATVLRIGDSAFRGCSGLAKITIPASVTKLGRAAFSRCTSLSSVSLPSSVRVLPDSLFEQCTSLKSIKLTSGITEIGQSAFYGCTGLAKITIPSSVMRIGFYAFHETYVGVILYQSSKANWDKVIFQKTVGDGELLEESKDLSDVFPKRCDLHCKNLHTWKRTIKKYSTVKTKGFCTVKCVFCSAESESETAPLVPLKSVTVPRAAKADTFSISMAEKKKLYYQGVEAVKLVMPENGKLYLSVSGKSNIDTLRLYRKRDFSDTGWKIGTNQRSITLEKGTYYLRIKRDFEYLENCVSLRFPKASFKLKCRYQ